MIFVLDDFFSTNQKYLIKFVDLVYRNRAKFVGLSNEKTVLYKFT